ncbi:hypothetical protein DFQ10_101874 [Winogradskyella eximia]|uniref:Uncharacterized protein n=1 Tax=Winogradskyella eximia TaxID=262006 RepID=A0A3D9HC64_9FLAO|nr:hypothetical protein DFQ10_101874 [Winogradskyella eximia]
MPKTLSFFKIRRLYVTEENKSAVLEFMVLFLMVVQLKFKRALKVKTEDMFLKRIVNTNVIYCISKVVISKPTLVVTLRWIVSFKSDIKS